MQIIITAPTAHPPTLIIELIYGSISVCILDLQIVLISDKYMNKKGDNLFLNKRISFVNYLFSI